MRSASQGVDGRAPSETRHRMTWVKLDDGFIRHRKIRQLSHRAIALHVAGLCHCAAQLTDGRIDKPDVPMLLADARVGKSVLSELVNTGCWHDDGDHYVIHDYLEYRESRETVLGRRQKWATIKRDRRDRSNGESTAESTRDKPRVSTVESDAECAHPDLTRPDASPLTG